MVAYLEKIDYVHTRMSVPITSDLSRGTYVTDTFRKILMGLPYDVPINKQLFDIIFLEDVVRAFYLIGMNGINKADYYIGTGSTATFEKYFEIFEKIVQNKICEVEKLPIDTENDYFSTFSIYKDTGFKANLRLKDIKKELYR
jgi:nucleoside-diphosphate-sugar epimerase